MASEFVLDVGTGEGAVNAITPPAPTVPRSVTPAQGKLALLGAGLLDEAEAAINSLTGDTKTAALIYWNHALAFERDNALIEQIGAAIGLDSDAIDDLFITAASL